MAVVPAFREEGAIAGVVRGIRAFDATIDIVVVDDGSPDGTAAAAAAAGAAVVRLPFNLGIGGAVQTGLRYAHERGYDIVVRLDGDGQHDPAELPKLLDALAAGGANVVVGSRFAGGERSYRPPLARRIGIVWFAHLVSLVTRSRVTDTTSGFQALDRRAITLLAHDYPTDYPEVEATLLLLRSGLRLQEVHVRMREREHGSSSITVLRSVYYVLKVTLAILVAMGRRAVPAGEGVRP